MRKTVTIAGIVIVVAAICFLAAGYAAIRLTKKPQATPLSLVTLTATQTAFPSRTSTPPEKTSLAPTSTATPTPTLTPEPPKVCGQSGDMVVLVLGRSIHKAKNVYIAELVRLIRLDFGKKKAVIFTLPAELVVSTPNMVEHYRTQNARLGDIFTIVVNTDGVSSESDYKATQAIAQAILDNFGVAADYYITIKEDVVMQVIDTLGGIELDLPQAFSMPDYSIHKGINLTPGVHLFDGDMVHAYMTYRENISQEWQRVSHQNVILEGLRKKVFEPTTFLKIPQLFELYRQAIVTDLSVEQIASLACLTRELPSQDIAFNGFPQEKVIISADGSMHLTDAPTLIDQLQVLFGIP